MRRHTLSIVISLVVVFGAFFGTLAAGQRPKLGLDLKGGLAVVLAPCEPASDEALNQARDIIRDRIDGLGVAEPNVLRQGGNIVVELPGVDDREKARGIVGRTAELQFRLVQQQFPIPDESAIEPTDTTILTDTTIPTDTTAATAGGTTTVPAATTVTEAALGPVNDGERRVLAQAASTTTVAPGFTTTTAAATTTTPASSTTTAAAPVTSAGESTTTVSTAPAPITTTTVAPPASCDTAAAAPTPTTLPAVPDLTLPTVVPAATGSTVGVTTDSTVSSSASTGATTAEALAAPVLAQAASTSTTTPTTAPTTATATATTTASSATTIPVATTVPGDATTTTANESNLPLGLTGSECLDPLQTCVAIDKDGLSAYLLGPSELSGRQINGDSADSQLNGGEWQVVVSFTDEGSQIWGGLTSANVGQQVAIVLDGVVQSAPRINQAILGGETQISGSFSQGEADDLALVLRYGALPVRLEELTAQEVSATLGKDQLNAGLIAGAIGLGIVVIYMLAIYRVLGLIVIAGLIITGLAVWSVISYLGETRSLTLTLAGVTGLIVSMGVAVDSFIIYFERLKDELKHGASVRSSVDRGFRKAWRTILAADFVSLLGAAILYWQALGAVRGFAFYLGLATLLDLLVAYFFMYPVVALLSRNPKLVGARRFGLSRALDVAEDAR